MTYEVTVKMLVDGYDLGESIVMQDLNDGLETDFAFERVTVLSVKEISLKPEED